MPENLSGGISVVCNASEQYLKLAEEFDDSVGNELRIREKSSQKIIDFIAANKDITTQEMAENLGISRRAVAKQIAKLQENNIIRRVGADKGGYWEIVK